jgi:hypothetical protein
VGRVAAKRGRHFGRPASSLIFAYTCTILVEELMSLKEILALIGVGLVIEVVVPATLVRLFDLRPLVAQLIAFGLFVLVVVAILPFCRDEKK